MNYEKMARDWDGVSLVALLKRVAAEQREKDIRIANSYRISFPTSGEPGRSIDYIVADIKAQGES